eukprot:4548975-Amphidinium_carterae.1
MQKKEAASDSDSDRVLETTHCEHSQWLTQKEALECDAERSADAHCEHVWLVEFPKSLQY